MNSKDDVENAFSDEDDSFDDPVPMSNCYEESEDTDVDEEERELDLEEEDFSLVTIENVSMDVLACRIGRIISEVLYRGETAATALFDVATRIVFQSTILSCERNTVIELIVHGLTRIILDEREREERTERGENLLMLLVVKLAIKNKSLKCDELLNKLIFLVERVYLHTNSFVRVRVCRLITLLVEEANRYAEAMQEHGDHAFLFTDDAPAETEVMIPTGVMDRWMKKLAKSLLDKSPQVRSSAVTALSLWDSQTIYKDRNCDEVTVNDLLWKSVHDVHESVRITAARRVHIEGEVDINKCMDYVESSKDNKVRQAIVIRLASDVHLFTLTEQQRFRLVNLLNNSESARVQDAIHQRLVDAWMRVAGAEIVCPTIFPAPNPDDNIPIEFPSIILEYLDPVVDPKAVYIFLKFATVRFIREIDSKKTEIVDLEKFMKFLLKMTPSESECVGLMRRSTFRLVESDCNDAESLKRTFTRIFITRCFLDVVFQLSGGRLDAVSLRNRALMFFVPDVVKFSDQLEQFCDVFYQKITESVEGSLELLLSNILHLLNVSVKHGNNTFEKETYKKCLEKLLSNPKLCFSDEVVVSMVTIILDLCSNKVEQESTCEWICETAETLLLFNDTEEPLNERTLEEAMKEGVVLERMYLRCAKMLLATCQHEEVREPSPAMSELFKAMIPALLGSPNEQIQVTGLELIGFAASIDFDNCGPYLKLTRLLILRDDLYLKATGIHTLVRVIKFHGFSRTAQSIFEEDGESDYEEALAKLFETAVVPVHGIALAQMVRDYLSMLSHGHYAWPKLISLLLLIIFQKSNEELQLVKLFNVFCKVSIRSKWSKAHLLQGFTRAINVVSKSSESDSNWNIGLMTSAICEHLSSVETIEEDDISDVQQTKDGPNSVNIEVELATRMISRAVSHPSSWFIRHVFTSMATSLSLQWVPIEQLRDFHNTLADGYTAIRFNSGKTTQIAVKRFLTHCEKVIALYDRRHGLSSKADLKKVKSELEDPDDIIAPTSSSGKKKLKPDTVPVPSNTSDNWDDDGLESGEEVDSDDSFECFPKATKSRKRRSVPMKSDSQKRPKINQPEVNLEVSYEL